MADPIKEVVNAPKAVIAFGEQHLFALILLVALLMVLFVKAEVSRPGIIVSKVAKAPLIGRWATTRTG